MNLYKMFVNQILFLSLRRIEFLTKGYSLFQSTLPEHNLLIKEASLREFFIILFIKSLF